MKPLVFLIIIAFSSVSVNAQSESLFKRKPMEEAKLKRLLQDPLSNLPPNSTSINPPPAARILLAQQTNNGVFKIPLKGVYVGDNGKGDEIYAMSTDNMPCLVPGKEFKWGMPVVGGSILGKNKPLLLKEENDKIRGDK
jgi:hypothetical protein